MILFQNALNVCRLRRRKQNLSIVVEKLILMHSLHQTQPTIQSLLSGNEFSGMISVISLLFDYLTNKNNLGALDLITTSRDIVTQDLRGVFSFRYLASQLEEIQSVIGKMLLGDFKTYISSEIYKDIAHAKVRKNIFFFFFVFF